MKGTSGCSSKGSIKLNEGGEHASEIAKSFLYGIYFVIECLDLLPELSLLVLAESVMRARFWPLS